MKYEFEEDNQVIAGFYKLEDEFIANRKELHEIYRCAHCDGVIEPDEHFRNVDGLPYHIECFKEIME